ncbi:TIGR03086 family metal-binding protein [Mycolicibacterium sp. J2]|uniref:TIGR03086 family metal-binding protein n=1 Tax=Mycolicibacterium sp. J2 TaxID=2993511 RepID=UPI00224A5047|nr:TIGR03086 family metal-binding protein [Mycolicibacterium sp. J2]MCX2713649.1 TIGR03086 family metal-binding protein [Mycolicibacterium sp. J2]
MIDEALDQSEQLWVGALSAVAPGDLDKPSGCDGWTIADLVNHVAGGGHRYAMLLDGADAAATALTRSNDYIGSDAVAQFWRYEQMLRDVAAVADLGAMVDHRAGRRSGTTLLNMRVMDLTLHAKDLCDGLGRQWEPSDGLASYLLLEVASTIDELRSIGLFGSATTPRSAAPADRLLALAGRR